MLKNTLLLRNIISYYSAELKNADIDSPVLSVELLLMHVLSYTKKYELLSNNEYILTDDEFLHFITLFKRRLTAEPIAYIIGKKEFYSRDFFLSNKTLIPRPETEELIENILPLLSQDKTYTILDIGTGSGCIALTLAKERTVIAYMLDISLPCLHIAQKNAHALGITQCVSLQANCLYVPFKENSFDLIISNPPYISPTEYSTISKEVNHEPYTALYAENNGLAYVTQLIELSYPLLKKEGLFCMEFGYRQKEILEQYTNSHAWEYFTFYQDYSKHNRYCIAKK